MSTTKTTTEEMTMEKAMLIDHRTGAANVPATRDEAIEAIVSLDVAKWGEAEREPSRRLRRKQLSTYGLALNTLAHYDIDHIDAGLATAAELALTPADRAELRKGG